MSDLDGGRLAVALTFRFCSFKKLYEERRPITTIYSRVTSPSLVKY